MYLATTRGSPVLFGQIRHNEAPEIQVPVRRRPEAVSYTLLDVYKRQEHNRDYYWEEEKLELMPLPSMHYEDMERKTVKVSSDFHVRFDNAY